MRRNPTRGVKRLLPALMLLAVLGCGDNGGVQPRAERPRQNDPGAYSAEALEAKKGMSLKAQSAVRPDRGPLSAGTPTVGREDSGGRLVIAPQVQIDAAVRAAKRTPVRWSSNKRPSTDGPFGRPRRWVRRFDQTATPEGVCLIGGSMTKHPRSTLLLRFDSCARLDPARNRSPVEER